MSLRRVRPGPVSRRFVAGAACLLSSAFLILPSQADRRAVQAGGSAQLADGVQSSLFADAHSKGEARSIRLVETLIGRLVDVHALTANGDTSTLPIVSQTIIDPTIQTDGVNYRLETDAVTQAQRLVILRKRGAAARDPLAFERLYRRARANLVALEPRPDLQVPGPLTLIPRNAALELRFDDLLDDSPAAVNALAQSLRVHIGAPASQPFEARVFFDENYGGIVNGRRYPTRVLVDLTVSALEAAASPMGLPLNALGLPESLGSSHANVELRLPTRTDAATGQFRILTNLAGNGLSEFGNGPIDPNVATRDVMRVARSGNGNDVHNGFLMDLDAPRLIGTWPLALETITAVPGGQTGFEFFVDLRFAGPCADDPRRGDVLELRGGYLRVEASGTTLDPSTGFVGDVRVRWLGRDRLVTPANLIGSGALLAPHDDARSVASACWLSFTPQSSSPGIDVDPSSQLTARFSEPMDPATIDAFSSFEVGAGDASQTPDAQTTVVADIRPSADLASHTFSPILPFDHTQGSRELFHARLDAAAIRDLTGNAVLSTPSAVEFTLDAAAPTLLTGGITLRFDDFDEFQLGAAAGAPDIRGQVLYSLTNGVLQPRRPQRFSTPIDRNNPVPAVMIPFSAGTNAPLTPLGSKLHQAWRYCDAGWSLFDEAYHNVDVEGLGWSPLAGQVIADFFPQFEIQLAHGAQAPDEHLNPFLLPNYPASGLINAPRPFSDNVLQDPVGGQALVHHRSLGYVIDPSELFVTPGDTPMMPYPMNRMGGPNTAYTWRDTAVLSRAGSGGGGAPFGVETEVLGLYGSGVQRGFAYSPGELPSIALPLLMEFRCFPSSTSLGLNNFDVSLAINSSARPNFRSHSTGGFNAAGQPVVKDPDLEVIPSGGFVPGTGAPTTPADNLFYLGQVDLVIRTSRAHSIWLDTGVSAPDFVAAIVQASAPAGTNVAIDYRGADGFSGGTGVEPFDAGQLDPYGDPPRTGPGATQVLYHSGTENWSSSLDVADGARFVQLRLSFLNDVAQGLMPELDAFAVAFLR